MSGNGEERQEQGKGREGKGKGERFKPESLYLPLVALPLVSMFLCCSLHLPRNGELAYRLLNQQLVTLPHSTIVAAQFILTLINVNLKIVKRTLLL